MEGKLKILSESKLTAIISFTCEGNIWYTMCFWYSGETA